MTSNIYDMSDTWNNAGTKFASIDMDVTDTASNVWSVFDQRSVGGDIKWSVTKHGFSDKGTARWGQRIYQCPFYMDNVRWIAIGGVTPVNYGNYQNQTNVGATNKIALNSGRGHWYTNLSAGNEAGNRPSTGNEWCRVGYPAGWYYNTNVMSANPASIDIGTALAGYRRFIGMFGNLSGVTLGNVEPNTQLNIIALAHGAADTNWKIMHNDASGTATEIDLGASFTCLTLNDDMYCFEILCLPSGTSVYYRVTNVDDPSITAQGEITTNLPATTVGLGGAIWVNNAAVASSAAISVTHQELISLAFHTQV